MKSEEAISKIRKLLKLSESPYEEEAKIALEKARKLMIQYHVEENDLTEEQAEDVIREEIKVQDVMIQIWYYIAKNHRCMSYTTDKRSIDGKLEHYMIIVGFKFDVECVKIMMNYIESAFTTGLRDTRNKIRNGETILINGEYKTFDRFESTRGLKNEYLSGFTKGLKSIIEEQNAQSEYHLMVITPKEVDSKYKDITSALNMTGYNSNRKYYKNNNNSIISHLSFHAGREAGKQNQLKEGD